MAQLDLSVRIVNLKKTPKNEILSILLAFHFCHYKVISVIFPRPGWINNFPTASHE